MNILEVTVLNQSSYSLVRLFNLLDKFEVWSCFVKKKMVNEEHCKHPCGHIFDSVFMKGNENVGFTDLQD